MDSVQLEKNLRTHLLQNLPQHKISEVYEYATLPGGKLFRPNLVWSILSDLDPQLAKKSEQLTSSPHALLASAVELHHSYTLIHDDLPCMDDDTMRRGKPCTHIVYGQWQALLAGDGLINISYQLLSKIKHARALELINFFSWALGPKGLIHGQVLDLSHEMTLSFENTLRTHELKTARLIQVSILGSAALCNEKNHKLEKKLWKFSRLLGINFQLIDDLSELSEEKLTAHEKDVNPWLLQTETTYQATLANLLAFNQLSLDLKLTETNKIIKDYYQKMHSIIATNKSLIEMHLNKKIDLVPVLLLIEQFS